MSAKIKNLFADPLILVAIIAAAYFANQIVPIEFNRYGIRPRTSDGLIGVPLSVFLHGGLNHLLNNIGSLLVLGILLRSYGRNEFIRATIGLTILSGFLTWLISSPAMVIGASGLVFAYWSYLITKAIREKTVLTILIAIVTLLIYGGLILSLGKFETGISWAAHFSGFIAGIIMAMYFKPKQRSRRRR